MGLRGAEREAARLGALAARLVDGLERLGKDGRLLLGARRLVEPAPVDENAHVRDALFLEVCPMGLEGVDDEPGQHHHREQASGDWQAAMIAEAERLWARTRG